MSLKPLTLSLGSMLVTVLAAAPSFGQGETSSSDGLVLEEITVTARKTEERLLDAPLSITAFSADDIEKKGFTNLEDVARSAPGVQYSNQGGQIPGRYNSAIRFRGMNVNSEQPVAQLGSLFIDGIYVASGCNSLGAEDLARIEVIKGPQAVYFGRNTFGGAINYVTKDPGNDWGGKTTVSLAEDDDYEVTGAVEGPIVAD